MPTLIIDTEQAALIGVACEMMTGALRARAERANPGKIITDSLHLQANKLETVLAELKQPEPPDYTQLDDGMRRRAADLCLEIANNPRDPKTNARWQELRRLATAPGFPTGTPKR